MAVAFLLGVNPPICKDADVQAIIAVALEGRLSDEQAERLAGLDPEVMKLVLLAAARQIGEHNARIAEQQARIAELESELAAAKAPGLLAAEVRLAGGSSGSAADGACAGHVGRRGRPSAGGAAAEARRQHLHVPGLSGRSV